MPIKFKHSGNAGDIVYSLWSIARACEDNNDTAIIYLNLNQPANYAPGFVHPLGNVMLNETMAKMLKPFLLRFEFVEAVLIYSGQKIDYDLDRFRTIGLNLGAGDIKRWYGYAYPELMPNTHIEDFYFGSTKDYSLKDTVLWNRTQRYQNGQIDYSILDKTRTYVGFIGLDQEFEPCKKIVNRLGRITANDFAECADFIQSCKLFIGNQSVLFAIAEAINANRALEVYFGCPNVLPHGGYEFYNQQGLEYVLKQNQLL